MCTQTDLVFTDRRSRHLEKKCVFVVSDHVCFQIGIRRIRYCHDKYNAHESFFTCQIILSFQTRKTFYLLPEHKTRCFEEPHNIFRIDFPNISEHLLLCPTEEKP